MTNDSNGSNGVSTWTSIIAIIVLVLACVLVVLNAIEIRELHSLSRSTKRVMTEARKVRGDKTVGQCVPYCRCKACKEFEEEMEE